MPWHAELVQLDHVGFSAVLSGDATSLWKAYSGGLPHGVIALVAVEVGNKVSVTTDPSQTFTGYFDCRVKRI